MSISTSSQKLVGQNPSHRNTPRAEGNPVRPQPALLKLLHMAGAKGDTFTLKQVMHHLGQYIMVKQLYDKQQQHIVHCGDDELGDLLGITSFSVKDPSPLYNMLKRNLYTVSCTDAAQSPSRDQTQDTSGLDHQKEPNEGIYITENRGKGDGESVATCSTGHKRLGDDLEGPSNSKQPRLELVLEEWDGAGLPWWFLGNLRTNYTPQSNGSTDIPSNQDIDTALVSDTTDDLWFLNDTRSDQINVEVKMEALNSPSSEGEDLRENENKVIELTIYEDNLEDTQSLGDDTDTEIAPEDCWQCTNCHKSNSAMQWYCFRCWALRKNWYLNCPRLTHALSTPTLPAKCSNREEMRGIDIPECRRTISAPMVRSRGLENQMQTASLEPLDLAKASLSFRSLSESTDSLLNSQSEEASIESSRPLLEPCKLCCRRPRNGNVVHGRTAHLVTCFTCARILQKTRKGCPVCQKPIQMVVKTYVA